MAETKGFPWVKLLVAGLVVYAIARCAPETAPEAVQAPEAPALHATVVSVTCDPNRDRPRATVVIRNTGPQIDIAQLFVAFGGQTQSGYFTPSTIPTGAMADALVYADRGASSACSLTAVQDRRGTPVTLSR